MKGVHKGMPARVATRNGVMQALLMGSLLGAAVMPGASLARETLRDNAEAQVPQLQGDHNPAVERLIQEEGRRLEVERSGFSTAIATSILKWMPK